MYDYANRPRALDHSMLAIKDSFEGLHQNLLEKIQSLDLELRTVSIGLQSKFEETLRLRDQKNRLFECLPIGAILVNQDGCIQQVNRAAREIDGLKSLLIEGKSLEQVWRQLNWPPVPFSHLSYCGRNLNCWEEVLGNPGTVPCLTVRFIEEDWGNPTRSKNVHERHMLAMGERVAKIAHDLRNSLTSIDLFASLVERRSCNESEHQRLGTHLVKSIRSLEQFVNNLLVGTKSHNIHIDQVNLHALFDQVELLLTQPLRERQVIIKRVVSPDVKVVEGDMGLLQQACLNLFNNAIAASREGGIIEIDCRKVKRSMTKGLKQDSTSEIRIRVRDYGHGIKKDDLLHVCTPFYSTENGGTGLGLSIVRDVMDAHHGTIDVRSREGQGTAVTLSFPQQRRSA